MVHKQIKTMEIKKHDQKIKRKKIKKKYTEFLIFDNNFIIELIDRIEWENIEEA